MSLAYDVSRCLGVECVVREGCLRYTERDNYGERTPFSQQLCDYTTPGAASFLIPVTGDTDQGARNE
jgi:hypothetical protein